MAAGPKMSLRLAGLAVVVSALLAAPVYGDGYFLTTGFTAMHLAALGLGFTMIIGFTGLLVMNYPAFVAVGAYTSAILMAEEGLAFLPAAVVGGVAAMVLGIAVGLVALRFSGVYVAIVTLALGEAVLVAVRNLEVTGGSNGLAGIPRAELFGRRLDTPIEFYYLAFGLLVVVTVVTALAARSRIGLAWFAVRDDEMAASVSGVPVLRLKLLAFAIGGLIAGIGGAVLAVQQGGIGPGNFNLLQTVLLLGIVVVGGLGSIRGVIVAAVFFTAVSELLRDVGEYRTLAYSAILVLSLLIRPRGFLPERRPTFQWLLRHRGSVEPWPEREALADDTLCQPAAPVPATVGDEP